MEIKKSAKADLENKRSLYLQLGFVVTIGLSLFAFEYDLYVSKNLKYPDVAAENGIQGTVYIQFVVEPSGSVSNVKVLRGVDTSLDKEAIRIVQSSPKWTPGKQRGKPVHISFTFPITFKLN